MQGLSEAHHQARRLRGRKNDPTLTEEQKVLLCHWMAEFATYKEVMRRAKEQFGLEINENLFYRFRLSPKWTPIIERFRAQWVKGIMQEPIAHKRTRLQKLAGLLEQVEKDAKASDWRKRMEIAKYLDQARLEMDEGKTGVTNLFLTQVNQFSEAELVQRRNELLERIKQWRPSHGSSSEVLPAQLRGDGSQTGIGQGSGRGDSPTQDPLGDGTKRPQHPPGA